MYLHLPGVAGESARSVRGIVLIPLPPSPGLGGRSGQLTGALGAIGAQYPALRAGPAVWRGHPVMASTAAIAAWSTGRPARGSHPLCTVKGVADCDGAPQQVQRRPAARASRSCVRVITGRFWRFLFLLFILILENATWVGQREWVAHSR